MINLRQETNADLFGNCYNCPLGSYLPNCQLAGLRKLALDERFQTIMDFKQKEVGSYMSKCFTCREEQYFATLTSNNQ